MSALAVPVSLASVVLLVYVLAGYPLLLAVWVSVRRARPVRRAPATPSVSVLLPVRNGERWLDAKLRTILELEYPRSQLQVIVIDDGSTDGTRAIVERYREDGVVVVAGSGAGKAAALSAGLEAATGDVLFFTDVRQRLDATALKVLVEHLSDPTVGVVSGELVILDGSTEAESNIGLYWRYEKWIRRRLSDLDSVLGATGCIYVMRRSLARHLPEGLLLDDVYLPLMAFFQGYRVLFTGEARAYDYPTGLESEFRRKVRTLAGNYQLIRYFPQLLLPTNRMWVHYLSHKLGRLLLPFALLALAVVTPWLPGPWGLLLGAGQVAFYMLALLDTQLADGHPLKRLTSPVRTFVVLMAAALASASILFLGSRGFWKTTQVREARNA